MQHMDDLFAKTCKGFGLTIRIPKAEVMYHPAPQSTEGQKLAAADKFVYLGSTMANNTTIEDEISLCISRANASFGRHFALKLLLLL